MSGFTMVDRGKFKVFEREARQRATIDQHATEAIKKEETAAAPTDGSVDMTNVAVRMGRPIQVGVFIDTLRRLNPNLIFQLSQGDPTKYGIYVPQYTADLITAVPVLNSTPRFITGMESGINLGGRINEGVMPEFSIIVSKETVRPDGDTIKKVKKFDHEIRGWRTVLAALFLEGLLTEAQIERTFRINQGQDSKNWRQRVNPGLTVAGGIKDNG